MSAMTSPRSARHVLQRLPPRIVRLLRQLGQLADEQGSALYLVGGVVRDLLLNRRNWDLDLTVEGDGVSFARLVADRYGAGLARFERFATARLIFTDGLKVDIASTRRESYADPAALPDVVKASLEEDLFRRDFTINAMAIQLNQPCWAELHDPYGGQGDLKHKVLRVLHDKSFIDDPTRIFRAIRFAERFKFRLEPNTARLLARAAKTDLVARLSGPRLANEMFALMREDRPEQVFTHLRRLRLVRFLHPRLVLGKRTERLMAVLPDAIGWWMRRGSVTCPDRSLLRIMALLAYAASSTISGSIERLQLSAVQARTLEWAGEQTARLVKILSGETALRPSQIYRELSSLPDEALILVLAKGFTLKKAAERARLTARLATFLRRDRHVVTTVNGDTLKQLGLQPGPHFKHILDRLLDERLDGRVTTAAEERKRARALALRYG
jgi:tRNA nucleotidyltransferase (CCA-adding enzyme)